MKKLQLGKDALILAILTLITVITWIAFDVYRILAKTEIPRILQKQIAPLDSKIPVTTLEELEERISFSQEELGQARGRIDRRRANRRSGNRRWR